LFLGHENALIIVPDGGILFAFTMTIWPWWWSLTIVPDSSDTAKTRGKVIPELEGRLTGHSLCVLVPVVSIIELAYRARPNKGTGR